MSFIRKIFSRSDSSKPLQDENAAAAESKAGVVSGSDSPQPLQDEIESKIGDLMFFGLGVPSEKKAIAYFLNVGEQAIPALKANLQNKDTPIRKGVWGMLGIFVKQNKLNEAQKREFMDFLVGELLSGDEYRPMEAGDVLHDIGDETVAERVRPLLTGENRSLKIRAISILGGIGDVEAVDELITLLMKDPDEYICKACATALGEIGDERAILPLIDALDSHSSKAKKTVVSNLDLSNLAYKALIRIGEPTLDPLLARFGTFDAIYTRRVACFVLGKIGDERAIEPLEALLKKPGVDIGTREIIEDTLTKIKLRGGFSPTSEPAINREKEASKVSPIILNPPTGKSQGFLLRKAAVGETLDLEKAGELKRSTIEEDDMEVYLLIPPEGEKFQAKDNLALKGNLVCPICALEMPIQIKEINFSGFLRADSCFRTSCSNCRSTTEFRGITTGKDSEDTSKFWLIVYPTTGPPGVRPRSQMSQPRIRMERIERSEEI